MLVDPPCTGLGVLSARPDARWRRREEALEPLTDLQRALLGRALALARPGGRVVYSTCTLIAEENEDVVAAAGTALDDLGAEYPGLAHPPAGGAAHAPAPPRHRRVLHRQDAPAVSAQAPPAGKVLPSLMSADPLRVGEQLDALIGAGARAFHVDVMDAPFVPNLTLGPDFARAVAVPIPRGERSRRRAPDGRSTRRGDSALRGRGRRSRSTWRRTRTRTVSWR